MDPGSRPQRVADARKRAFGRVRDDRNEHGHQFIVIVEKSTNQLFGCTKFLILGVIARGPTSWATHRNAASSTERSCRAASALSRAAGSKRPRTAPGRP